MTSLGIGISAGHSKFTRTNRVIGVGCELTF